jgi:hypothetical protein
MAKQSFDPEIRDSMKPKTPPQLARADGASKDQAAQGHDLTKPTAPGDPHVQVGNEQAALPGHLAAAAGIAHAILNSRPVKG